MQQILNLVPLRTYCKLNQWPRLPQWQHWITKRDPIAQKCIKKIGKRYYINIQDLQNYIASATLDEHA